MCRWCGSANPNWCSRRYPARRMRNRSRRHGRACPGQQRLRNIKGRRHMKRSDLTEKLLDIKRDNGWSWKHICEKIGGYSEVLIVGAILGQMKLTKPQAANAA